MHHTFSPLPRLLVALSLAAPVRAQGAAPEPGATPPTLSADRTLYWLQVPDPGRMLAVLPELPVLGLLERRRWKATFDSLLRWRAAVALAREYAPLATLFDDGLCFVGLPEAGYWIGDSSDAKRIRAHRDLVRSLATSEQGLRAGLVVDERPALDLPVRYRWLRTMEPRAAAAGYPALYAGHLGLLSLHGGRRAVLEVQPRPACLPWGEVALDEAVALCGLKREPGRRSFGGCVPEPGLELVAAAGLERAGLAALRRLVAGPTGAADFIPDPHAMAPALPARLCMQGLDGLERIESRLFVAEDGLVEDLVLRLRDPASATLCRPARESVADLAPVLSEDTVLALSAGLDVAVLRSLTGPDAILDRLLPAEGTFDLHLLVVNSPKSGTLPEPVLLLRRRDGMPTPTELVAHLSTLLARSLGGADTEVLPVETFGDERRDLRYIKFARYLGEDIEEAMDLLVWSGGGYVAATRLGDWLVLGCHPRTLRSMQRALAEGRVLAAEPGFTAGRHAAPGACASGFIDFDRLATRCGFLGEIGVEMFVMIELLSNEGAAFVQMPTADRLLDLFDGAGRQRLALHATVGGFRLRMRDVTLLSPTQILLAWEGLLSLGRIHALTRL